MGKICKGCICYRNGVSECIEVYNRQLTLGHEKLFYSTYSATEPKNAMARQILWDVAEMLKEAKFKTIQTLKARVKEGGR